MNNLINKNNELSLDICKKIAENELKLKIMQEQNKKFKEQLLIEMEERGIKKIENDYLLLSYIEPTDRETFDSKALKEDDQDTYDKYVKISPIKSSVRIKVKDFTEAEEKINQIKEILN